MRKPEAGGETPPAMPSAGEVVEWFREAIKSRPIPNEQQVTKIVQDVNLLRAMRAPAAMAAVSPHYEAVQRVHDKMAAATAHVAKARAHLADALRMFENASGEPVAGRLPAEASLLAAMDAYLAEHTPRRRGRQERDWDFYTCILKVEHVRDALLAAGWLSPSLVTDAGPVSAVFSRILFAATGTQVKAKTLARYARLPRDEEIRVASNRSI